MLCITIYTVLYSFLWVGEGYCAFGYNRDHGVCLQAGRGLTEAVAPSLKKDSQTVCLSMEHDSL